MKSSKEVLNWILSFKQPVIFNLLPVLCDEGNLCSVALDMLQSCSLDIGSRLNQDLSPLVEQILLLKEELSHDASFLLRAMKNLYDEKPKVGKKLMNAILDFVIDAKNPMHLRCSCLFLMAQIKDKEILIKLMPVAKDVLDRISNLTKDELLEPLESNLLYYILRRFSDKDSEFYNSKEGWNIFLKAIEITASVLQIDGSLMSPQDLVGNFKSSKEFNHL